MKYSEEMMLDERGDGLKEEARRREEYYNWVHSLEAELAEKTAEIAKKMPKYPKEMPNYPNNHTIEKITLIYFYSATSNPEMDCFIRLISA